MLRLAIMTIKELHQTFNRTIQALNEVNNRRVINALIDDLKVIREEAHNKLSTVKNKTDKYLLERIIGA